jgi:hypothetical protein
MVDEKTLDCMLATQLWMHSVDTIEDTIESIRTLPEPREKYTSERYMNALYDADYMLEKITPKMMDCTRIIGRDAAKNIEMISDIALAAVEQLLSGSGNYEKRLGRALDNMKFMGDYLAQLTDIVSVQ